MQQIMVQPHSKKDIIEYTYYVRNQLGLGNKLYIPVLYVAENIIPMTDETFSCVIMDENVMKNEYANYSPGTNELRIRSDVYDDVYSGVPRHRFTIAHELGHYFMHSDIATFSRCDNRYAVPRYRDPEWQANVFASAFLMPPNQICYMTISDVAKKCGTSMQAAEIALKTAKKSQATTLNSFSF